MTIGELAKRVGVSNRTLRYYDEIGLLAPSRHSPAGYRLYGAGDVARLQQIRSLRQLGFSLEEIRACLTRPDYSPLRVVELHLAEIRRQQEALGRLAFQLDGLAMHLRSVEGPSSEEFLRVLESTSVVGKYHTPEQLEQLAKRREELGEAGMRRAEADWAELIDQVQAEMDKGTDPTEPHIQALARRWMALVESFTGGDPGIQQSLQNLWNSEETVHGLDAAQMRKRGEYIGKALAASKA